MLMDAGAAFQKQMKTHLCSAARLPLILDEEVEFLDDFFRFAIRAAGSRLHGRFSSLRCFSPCPVAFEICFLPIPIAHRGRIVEDFGANVPQIFRNVERDR